MMDALVQMVRWDYDPHIRFIDVLVHDPANADLVQWAKVAGIPASYFLSRTGQSKRSVGWMKQAGLRQELAALMAEAQSD